MKITTLKFCILLILLCSCKHHRDITSEDFLWNDVNSLVTKGENYRVFYLDSSFYKKSKWVELDSNIRRKNIFTLDEQLSKHLENISQYQAQGGMLECHFYIMDTIILGTKDRHLLLLEQCNAFPPGVDYTSLILAHIINDSILSSFNLAMMLPAAEQRGILKQS